MVSIGPSNCDSYIYGNKADNGIFNYSLWSPNKKNYYKATTDGVVKMDSGQFYLLIDGHGLKKNQYYTYEIYKNNTAIKQDNTFYYKSTCLSGPYYFLNKSIPEDYLDNPKIFGKNDHITVKVHIYEMEHKDPFSFTGDLGHAQIVDYSIHKSSATCEQVCMSYTSKPYGIPLHSVMTKFTSNPVVYSLKPYSDNERNVVAALKILEDKRLGQLVKMASDAACKIVEMYKQIESLTKDLETQKELLSKYNSHIAQLS
jgi:hypothetical protein